MQAKNILIEMRDGAVCACTLDGPMPLFMHGEKVSQQGPHWFYDKIYEGPCGVNFVELRTNDGRLAVHYYSLSMVYLCNTIHELGTNISSTLVELYLPAFKDVWETLVCGNGNLSSISLQLVGDLGAGSRTELSQHVKDLILPVDDIRVFNPHEPLPTQFCASRIQALFSVDLLNVQTKAVTHDTFSLPSPFGPYDNASTHGFLILHNDYYTFYAYRFIDKSTDVAYYVICGDWNYRILALFVPSSCLTLFPTVEHRAFYAPSAHVTVRDAIYAHFAAHADIAFDYLRCVNAGSVILTHYWHLGHHLWNELTGLKWITNAAPAAKLPVVVVVGADVSEMYGRIDQLFPNFTGKIDRSISNTNDFCSYLYQNRKLMLHPTHDYIDQSLASRIIEHSATDFHTHEIDRYLTQFREKEYCIFVLGLRVENRTLIDLYAFCYDVIECLKTKNHGVVVVVDGHNRPDGAAADDPSFRSLHDHLSVRPPIDAEFLVFSALLTAFSDDNRVEIVSTIGLPVSASVHWCNSADFYVTPWGAGLAKYKWVCNKPGLIVSNTYFLTIGESYLYDTPDYREAPERTFRILPNEAEDLLDIDLVIPLRDPLRTNFRVDLSAVRRELNALLLYKDRKDFL